VKKMIAAILAAMVCTTTAVAADETWGAVMVRAYHSDRTSGYNENTLGLGIEHRKEGSDFRLVAGAYNNSYNHASAYGGVTWLPVEYGPFKAGMMVGLISGYPRYSYNFGPIAAGILTVEKNGYGANIMVVPPVPGGNVAGPSTWTTAVQLKMRYD
jgi:hypothetical protein